MEDQRDPESTEVDVEAHAVVQYMMMRAKLAAVALTMVIPPAVFQKIPIEERVKLINNTARIILPTQIRAGFELIRSKDERNHEGEKRKFQEENTPDKRYEDFLQIINCVLENFEQVRKQAEEVGDMTQEQMERTRVLYNGNVQ